MESNIKKLRYNQLLVTNIMFTIALFLFWAISSLVDVTFFRVYIILGILILLQTGYSLVKGDSTKSFIPIFEKVAIYEKQKMGKEWSKQRKVSSIINFFLACWMFFLAYENSNSNDEIFSMDVTLMLLLMVSFLCILNISLWIHFRKVEKAVSEVDMKGYTWKSFGIALVLGVVFSMVIVVFTIFWVISSS